MLAEALALPPEGRAKLLCRLIDSLNESTATRDDEKWIAEVNRRLALYRSGELKALPMEHAIAQLRTEFPD